MPSEASRDILLIENKAPYQKQPNCRIPQYHKPSSRFSRSLPIASCRVLVYRPSPLKQLRLTAYYNVFYNGDTNHRLGLSCGLEWYGGTRRGGVSTPVDYGAASTDTLYPNMEEIDSGTRLIEYIEHWFADSRVNTNSFERMSPV